MAVLTPELRAKALEAALPRTLGTVVELAGLHLLITGLPLASGDLVGGLRRGIQMLAEHARAPQTLHAASS